MLRLEDELIELAARSYADLGQEPPQTLRKRSAEERDALQGAGGA